MLSSLTCFLSAIPTSHYVYISLVNLLFANLLSLHLVYNVFTLVYVTF